MRHVSENSMLRALKGNFNLNHAEEVAPNDMSLKHDKCDS